MDDLSWAIDREHPVLVLRLAGQLRLRTVPVVRGLLLKCLAECPAGVVVDLAGFTVSQPQLLAVFPAVLDKAAVWPGVPIVLAAPDENVSAILGGFAARTVPVRATVGEAIEAAGGSAPLGRLRIHLPPTVAAAAEARRFTHDACAAWDLGAIADEAAVIVTELTDNAARHARTEFTLTLSYRGRYLHVAVHDRAPEPARKFRIPDPAEPAPVIQEPTLPGKGLRLVDAFATAWGTLPTTDGKTTWATIRVD